ncbi:hypothetical protein [Brevundimonas vesicularis]|uniref:hypothetical protein n=1 Tax=Brevundimonas vesicularis TaxID=41276 RepID=UPI0038D480E0
MRQGWPLFLANLVAAVALALALPASAQIGADLNISPKRVVFGPGERSAVVYVFNQGDQPATYTVEMVDRIMLPDGQIVPASDRPELDISSAADLVQHTPRRVTLQPRESQAIRLRARPGGDGTAEHRSHLTITALPPEDSGFTAAQAAAGNEDVALQVIALFSVSIPVIVRDNTADARAAITNARLQQGPSGTEMVFDLDRLGASSVYGDLEVRLGAGDDAPLMTAVRGVAVYPEISKRTVRLALPQAVAAGQTLTLVYRDDDARAGEVLAMAQVIAP